MKYILILVFTLVIQSSIFAHDLAKYEKIQSIKNEIKSESVIHFQFKKSQQFKNYLLKRKTNPYTFIDFNVKKLGQYK
jgi:hypothetical protein